MATKVDLPIGVIGICGTTEITNLQIMVPMGNRTKYEAILRNKDRVVVSVENENYMTLRAALAETMQIGLKYTDAVLAATINFNARLEAAAKANKPSALLSQFQTEHVTYSVVHHPAERYAYYNPEQDRTEPEFYRAVAQLRNVEDPDECLIFDDCADTLFDAVVIIRNHIEKSLMTCFMKGAI
uniref:Uncharacterized protein n=1 Tax=Pseudomonas phage Nican01 TaxID=3138540 RepID=A0AAU6W0P0_9CAUD